MLDLLSREALDFYKKGYYNITKPIETYTITEKNAFLSTQELQNLKRPAGDTIFSKYDVLQLYAALEQLHQSKKDAGAYVSILLERLDYEKNFLGQSKDLSRYVAYHNLLLETYKDQAVSTLVSYSLADYHYQLSLQRDEKTRQKDRDKAIEIAKKAVNQFPESYGTVKCLSLLSTIYRPSLSIQHQNNIIPNELHRGVITYRNVDNASIYFIKVPYDFDRITSNSDSIFKANLKAAQTENRIAFSKEINLKSSEDTFEHTYEFEPGGLGYYQSTKDVATHFFFDNVSKGTYVFEYEVRANNAGNFSNGITTLESMYAPEFSSHSAGDRVLIKE